MMSIAPRSWKVIPSGGLDQGQINTELIDA
jgi:hypothetical protein